MLPSRAVNMANWTGNITRRGARPWRVCGNYEFAFLNDHCQLLDRVLHDPPEFVLNLCDTGFRNIATLELHIPALLELLDIPYSGATPACIALCYDKRLVRLAAFSRCGEIVALRAEM